MKDREEREARRNKRRIVRKRDEHERWLNIGVWIWNTKN
jgi:hypothetical protein